MSAVVYRAFDRAGRLLYVGCTVELDARLRYHADHSAWHLFYDRLSVEEYDTQAQALAAESVAITTEHPRWNMKGRSPAHPDGHCTSYANAPWLDYEFGIWRRVKRLREQDDRLLRQIRLVRFDLAGAAAEIEAIKSGFVLVEEAIA